MLLAYAGSPALAQEAAPEPAKPAAKPAAQEGKVEEITIVGTKRDISQQEAPVAVSTLTGDFISKTFSNDLRTVATLSPNVTLTNQTGFNAVAGGIRGTGSISILTTQDASVGISIDDFALNHVQAQFVELFDVAQVEVYRGPQGTLFGKNSTGGAIQITTVKPNLEVMRAVIEGNYGGFKGGAETRKVKAAFDIPLIEGKLGFRFAGVYDDAEGFYRNSKSAAGFPNNIPLYGLFGLPVSPGLCPLPPTPACAPLPPELNLRTKGNGERLGGKSVFAGKLKLLFKPSDLYEGLLTYEISRDRSQSPPGVNETPDGEGFLFQGLGFNGIASAGQKDPFKTGVSQQGNGINIRDGHVVDVDGVYLNQVLDFDKFSVKSITGYRHQVETLPSTYTGEAFTSLFDASRNLERDQIQQELRLVTDFDGPINFVAGGGYFVDNLDFRAIATIGLISLIPQFNTTTSSFLDPRGFINLNLDSINDPGLGNVHQDRTSYAFYADGTWAATDKLTLTGGVRYTSDKKEFEKHQNGGGACNQYTQARDAVLVNPALPFSLANCLRDNRSSAISRAGLRGDQYDPRKDTLPDANFGLNIDSKKTWNDVTWRVAADYNLTDKILMYATIATGYLSGGFSETCSTIFTCGPFDQETNINYEVGAKADFLDETLRVNIAGFYMKFEDLQRNQVVPFTDAAGNPGQETITVNAGKSHSAGFEVETTWLPIPELELGLNVGYLNAKYDEFRFDPAPNNPLVGVTDFGSLKIPFAPEWNTGFHGTYRLGLSNGASLAFNLSGHYQGESETSPFDPNAAALGNVRHPTFSQMESRFLLNTAVTYLSPSERYHVSVYGRNLLDERYRATANSVAALWNFTQYGAPLEWGIEVGVAFGD
jgi:iron complex outermembrane receptor protein